MRSGFERRPEADNISDDLLSAYIDGEVDERERVLVEAALAADPRAARRLASLKRTVQMLQDMPRVPVPRAFTLNEKMLGIAPARQTTPWWSWLLRGGIVMAVLALAVTLGVNYLGRQNSGTEVALAPRTLSTVAPTTAPAAAAQPNVIANNPAANSAAAATSAPAASSRTQIEIGGPPPALAATSNPIFPSGGAQSPGAGGSGLGGGGNSGLDASSAPSVPPQPSKANVAAPATRAAAAQAPSVESARPAQPTPTIVVATPSAISPMMSGASVARSAPDATASEAAAPKLSMPTSTATATATPTGTITMTATARAQTATAAAATANATPQTQIGPANRGNSLIVAQVPASFAGQAQASAVRAPVTDSQAGSQALQRQDSDDNSVLPLLEMAFAITATVLFVSYRLLRLAG